MRAAMMPWMVSGTWISEGDLVRVKVWSFFPDGAVLQEGSG